MFAAQEYAVGVDGEVLTPQLQRHLLEGYVGPKESRIVDQYIESAEVGVHDVQQRDPGRLIGDIQRQEACSVAELSGEGRAGRRVHVGNDHTTAGVDESAADGTADTASGARHHDGLVLEGHVSHPAAAPARSACRRAYGYRTVARRPTARGSRERVH